MGIFDSLKSVARNHFDKQKEEREIMERAEKEAKAHRLTIFEQELKANSFKVAEAKAKSDAASKSGLQKLRATNRARNLATESQAPGSFFEKLGDLTKRNIANRESNLKRTAEMRATAKKMREDRAIKQNQEREQRMQNIPNRKPFSQSTWKM